MTGHAPFARDPRKAGAFGFDRIPLAGAVTRLGLIAAPARGSLHHLIEVEAFQPAAPLQAAGLSERRAERGHQRAKGSEPPCGKVWPDPPACLVRIKANQGSCDTKSTDVVEHATAASASLRDMHIMSTDRISHAGIYPRGSCAPRRPHRMFGARSGRRPGHGRLGKQESPHRHANGEGP